jgi:chaperone LolA
LSSLVLESRRRVLAAMLATPMALPLAVAHASEGEAEQQLRRFLAGTRSARGEFTQTLVRPGGRVLETLKGRFAFIRPGRFRWEVLEPYRQLLLADGETLFFFDEDLNQVTERRLDQALAATPAAILFGSESIDRDFTIKPLGSRDGQQWLEAVPRVREAGVERIAMGFADGLPQALEVLDAFERLSRFSLRAIERNPPLNDALFRFTAPAGADVVRQ